MRLRRYVPNTAYWLGLVLPCGGIVIDPAKPPTSQTWLTQFGHGSLRKGISMGNRLPDCRCVRIISAEGAFPFCV